MNIIYLVLLLYSHKDGSQSSFSVVFPETAATWCKASMHATISMCKPLFWCQSTRRRNYLQLTIFARKSAVIYSQAGYPGRESSDVCSVLWTWLLCIWLMDRQQCGIPLQYWFVYIYIYCLELYTNRSGVRAYSVWVVYGGRRLLRVKCD